MNVRPFLLANFILLVHNDNCKDEVVAYYIDWILKACKQ